MLSRSQALAIFSTMGDDQLMEALESVGVPTQTGRDYLDAEDTGGTLEPWNARQVTLGRGPQTTLVDKSKLYTPMPVTQRRANPEPDYRQRQIPDGYEQYAMHSGE